jgi:hypothetical protein
MLPPALYALCLADNNAAQAAFLGVTITLVLLNCRLTEDVNEDIDKSLDASKLSLRNLLDPTFRHQLMASFLNNSGLMAGSCK